MISLTNGKLTLKDGKLMLGLVGKVEHAPDVEDDFWRPPASQPTPLELASQDTFGLYANGALVVLWEAMVDSEDTVAGECTVSPWGYEYEFDSTSTGHTKAKLDHFGGTCELHVLRQFENADGKRQAQIKLTGGRARETMTDEHGVTFMDVMHDPYSWTLDLVQDEENNECGVTLLLA